MNIQEFIDKANSCGHEVWISGGASEKSIQILEKEMGVVLPKSLRNFFKDYGAISIYDSQIVGVSDSDPLKVQNGWMYGSTMIMREDFSEQYEVPQNLWVLEPHEDGAYCLNLDIKTNGDEFGIVNYEPYLPKESFAEVLASTFPEYLEKWYFPSYLEKDE